MSKGSGCDPWFILRFMQAGCAFPSCSERKTEKENVKWWLPKDIGMYLLHMDGRPGQSPVHAPLEAPRISQLFWAADGALPELFKLGGFSGTVLNVAEIQT